MLGKLSEKDARRFLDENVYGRIGCHAFGKTYVVPISYAHKDGRLYFHTFEGLKLKMMRENPDVCFQVDSLADVSNWKSVIANGKFRELSGEERKEGIRVLLDRELGAVVSETVKLTPGWPFTSKEIPEIPGVVFSIDVEDVTGRFEKSEYSYP